MSEWVIYGIISLGRILINTSAKHYYVIMSELALLLILIHCPKGEFIETIHYICTIHLDKDGKISHERSSDGHLMVTIIWLHLVLLLFSSVFWCSLSMIFLLIKWRWCYIPFIVISCLLFLLKASCVTLAVSSEGTTKTRGRMSKVTGAPGVRKKCRNVKIISVVGITGIAVIFSANRQLANPSKLLFSVCLF